MYFGNFYFFCFRGEIQCLIWAIWKSKSDQKTIYCHSIYICVNLCKFVQIFLAKFFKYFWKKAIFSLNYIKLYVWLESFLTLWTKVKWLVPWRNRPMNMMVHLRTQYWGLRRPQKGSKWLIYKVLDPLHLLGCFFGWTRFDNCL